MISLISLSHNPFIWRTGLLSAVFLDRKNTLSRNFSVFYVSIQAAFVCLFAYFANRLFVTVFGDVVSMFMAGLISVAVFAVTYYVFFVLKESEDGEGWKSKLT